MAFSAALYSTVPSEFPEEIALHISLSPLLVLLELLLLVLNYSFVVKWLSRSQEATATTTTFLCSLIGCFVSLCGEMKMSFFSLLFYPLLKRLLKK